MPTGRLITGRRMAHRCGPRSLFAAPLRVRHPNRAGFSPPKIKSQFPMRGLPNANVVLRASDAQKLQRAKRAVEDLLQRVRGAQSSRA